MQTQQAPALGKRKHEEAQSDLTLDEVRKAVPALEKMLRRWRNGKRQYGKRVLGDLSLSHAQIVLLANRYRAARNANREVDYKGASSNVNFSMFRGQPDKLKEKEPEVIALMRRALDEQSEIGDDEHNLTSKEWSERLAQTMEKHKEEIEKLRMELHEEKKNKLTTDAKGLAAIRIKLDGRATELEQKEKEQAAQYQTLSRELAKKAAELDKETRELQQQREELEKQAQVLKQERELLKQQLNRQTGNKANAQRIVVAEQEQQNRFVRLRLDVLNACCQTVVSAEQPAATTTKLAPAAASRSARSTRPSVPNSQDDDAPATQPEFSRKTEPSEAGTAPEVIVIDSHSSSPAESEDCSSSDSDASSSRSADNEEHFGSGDGDSDDCDEECKAPDPRLLRAAQRLLPEPPQSNFAMDSTAPSAVLSAGNTVPIREIDSEETETE